MTYRLTNGSECFTCTVTAIDDSGAAELTDSRGGKYFRDGYNGGWKSDAAEEYVTAIAEGETDENAKARLLAEVRGSEGRFAVYEDAEGGHWSCPEDELPSGVTPEAIGTQEEMSAYMTANYAEEIEEFLAGGEATGRSF